MDISYVKARILKFMLFEVQNNINHKERVTLYLTFHVEPTN